MDTGTEGQQILSNCCENAMSFLDYFCTLSVVCILLVALPLHHNSSHFEWKNTSLPLGKYGSSSQSLTRSSCAWLAQSWEIPFLFHPYLDRDSGLRSTQESQGWIASLALLTHLQWNSFKAKKIKNSARPRVSVCLNFLQQVPKILSWRMGWESGLWVLCSFQAFIYCRKQMLQNKLPS